jgi:hypothetical protein
MYSIKLFLLDSVRAWLDLFPTRGPNRNCAQRRPSSQKGRQLNKFCRICFLLNKGSHNIYTSHNITTCNKLSDRDKQEMARGAAI